MTEKEPRQEWAAGATTLTQADIKGKIVEFAWYLKKQGRKPETIKVYSKYLNILIDEGPI